MTHLEPHKGIPRYILLMMAALAGITVANIYYNQALLDLICKGVGISQVEANLVTVITQVGYALGLLFVIPLAAMPSDYWACAALLEPLRQAVPESMSPKWAFCVCLSSGLAVRLLHGLQHCSSATTMLVSSQPFSLLTSERSAYRSVTRAAACNSCLKPPTESTPSS